MLEKTIKLAVKKRLNELGAYQFWPVQMGLGATTVDCLACYKGVFVAIETKRPGGKLTFPQKLTIEKIEAAGGIALVVDSKEKARELFNHFEGDQETIGSIRGQNQGIVAKR